MGSALLSVRAVTFAYAGERNALADVSFDVEPGERVGLVGPNGAGKTTLFLCLAGVLKPSSGTIRLLDLDPASPAHRSQLPRHVGLVFQDSDDQLFCPSVRDEVAFGPLNLGWPADLVRAAVAEALGQVHLEGYEDRAPHHLSGGEKRRVALAGVLAMRPELLLLDEPTSHLDPRGRRALTAILQSLPTAMLIASHDLDFILATCHRALVFDQGAVVAAGDLPELFTDAALMEKHGLEVPPRLGVPPRP